MSATEKFAAGNHPAGIAGIDVFHALPAQKHADLEIRDDLRARLANDFDRIADVIIMAVRQHDMGDPRRRFIEAAREFRIAGEEGVDEDMGLSQIDAKGRMAEPGDFHGMGLRCGAMYRAGAAALVFGLGPC